MSHVNLYYVELIEMDVTRKRSKIRQFVMSFVLAAALLAVVYLMRG
jgi:predicted nucleic acid-binding Zn ribbon protein